MTISLMRQRFLTLKTKAPWLFCSSTFESNCCRWIHDENSNQ